MAASSPARRAIVTPSDRVIGRTVPVPLPGRGGAVGVTDGRREAGEAASDVPGTAGILNAGTMLPGSPAGSQPTGADRRRP